MPLEITDIRKISKLVSEAINKSLAPLLESIKTFNERVEKIETVELVEIRDSLNNGQTVSSGGGDSGDSSTTQLGGERITEVEQKNKALEELVQDLQDRLKQVEDVSQVGVAPVVNSAEVEDLKKQLEALKETVKNLKVGEEEFNLQNEFPNIFAKSNLKLDYASNQVTGKMLNQMFKGQLKPNDLPAGFKNFEHSLRSINEVLTLRE
jgi:DNA repair exonuclease SbcCD ATPase subunit